MSLERSYINYLKEGDFRELILLVGSIFRVQWVIDSFAEKYPPVRQVVKLFGQTGLKQETKVQERGNLEMMKITSDTLKMLNKLPDDKRQKVDAIVRRHVRACQQNGFNPENLERAYIEAIEMVDIEDRFPDPVINEDNRTWEPFRQYDQYISPKAA